MSSLHGGPLRSRNFRLLAACNGISVAGSQVSAVAIPFAVLRSGGSASDVGYVATAELIAMIACLLLGGVIADRLPRHHVAEKLARLVPGNPVPGEAGPPEAETGKTDPG